MSHYKRNADANRDALFGSSSSSSKPKPSTTRPRKQPAVTATTTRSSISTGRQQTGNFATVGSSSTGSSSVVGGGGRSSIRSSGTGGVMSVLSGAAKVEKMKEAEGYRDKAKKALQRTMFSRPDPIAGGMYYHKAAEAYQTCGENRLERLHRIASADCQRGHSAHATAAAEYARAALLAETSEETLPRRRAECRKLWGDAADSWAECGERGRSGECRLKAAYGGLLGMEEKEGAMVGMGESLAAVEEGVEAFVPDPLNRRARYRKTGSSLYVDPDNAGGVEGTGTMDDETLATCEAHLVTDSYSHETLFKAAYRLTTFTEYSSALYAIGAVITILEKESISTVSLSRAYVAETVLALAMGDVVAAEEFFLKVHLQKTFYLESRECKLAEDLIRAVKERDVDDLEVARDPGGENRAALANMNPALRKVVLGLRITGAVKKKTNVTKGRVCEEETPGNINGDELQKDLDASFKEMGDLMDDMGLGDDDDEDDEIDLR